MQLHIHYSIPYLQTVNNCRSGHHNNIICSQERETGNMEEENFALCPGCPFSALSVDIT